MRKYLLFYILKHGSLSSSATCVRTYVCSFSVLSIIVESFLDTFLFEKSSRSKTRGSSVLQAVF